MAALSGDDMPLALLNDSMQQGKATVRVSSLLVTNVVLLLQQHLERTSCICRMEKCSSWVVGVNSFQQAPKVFRTVHYI